MNLVYPICANEKLTSFEIRLLDHTSNMYLAFALMIMYGIKGLQEKIELP